MNGKRYIQSEKKHSLYSVPIWLGIIVMQIYEFLTWYIRVLGGNINCQLSYSYFYLAVSISIISYIIYKVVLYKTKQQDYIFYSMSWYL